MTITQKPEVIILSGLPASGKSKFAKEWLAEDPDGRVRINYDDLRLARYGEDWVFNWKDEQHMKAAARVIAEKALTAGLSVVVDNTNLTEKARQPWVDLGKQFGASVTQMEIAPDTGSPVHTCVIRDRLRTGRARVGRGVIDNMALHHGFIDWEEELPRSKVNGSGKDIILLDLDGTLCNSTHRIRHILSKPKNWDAFFAEVDKDTPYPVIQDLVDIQSGFLYIIVVTGRPDDKCGIATDDWLQRHKVYPKFVFMRKAGDKREDFVIKKEVLDLLPRERIAFALEDRTQVVKMYREQGITCLQVREGDF